MEEAVEEKEKKIEEKDPDVSIEVDVETIENRVRSELKKKQEKEKSLEIEAERISYLNSIKVEDIKDETVRRIIEEVLESPLGRKDKVDSVKKLVAQSKIADCLRRAETVGEEQLNGFALKKCRELQRKGRNLSAEDLMTSESYLGTLEEDFERIGKQNLREGVEKEVDVESLSGHERFNFELKKKIRETSVFV